LENSFAIRPAPPAAYAAGYRMRSPPAWASAVHAAAPHTDGMNILPGRAAPSQTLPRAGAWGNQVPPHPAPKDNV